MDTSGGEAPERLALARLDKAAKDFGAVSRHLEALECMEKALVLRTRLFGLRADEVRAGGRGGGARLPGVLGKPAGGAG